MENKSNKIIILITTILFISIMFVFFLNKEEKVYVLEDYDSETKKTITKEYVVRNNDTILNGKFVIYNEKGGKIGEGTFVDGHIKGKCTYYYDDGKLESIYYRKTSKITEEAIEYYPNGKVKRYTMFGPTGLEAFISRYDEQGDIKSYEGYCLMEIYQYPIANQKRFKININQYLKVGDTLKHQYLMANIPNARRSLKIENIDIDNAKVKRTFKKTYQRGFEVKEVLTKKGTNKIRAIVKYEFNDKEKTVINDTITFEVKVN